MHLWDFKRAGMQIWDLGMLKMSDTSNHSESYPIPSSYETISLEPTKPWNNDLHNNVTIKKIKLCLKIDLVCRNWTLGMQISKFRYANMDFFQNTGYSNTIFGKWLGIQIWIAGAFYLSLTLCPVHAVIILQPRVIHPSWIQEKVSVSDSALSLETDLKILICSKPWP